MTHRTYRTLTVLFALALPGAVLADVSNTVTLSSGQNYSFDNTATSTSGGDMAFAGSSINPVGSATFFSLGAAGSAGYGALTAQTLGFLTYSSTPITGLATNFVFAVKTNGGHYAKVLVNTVSSSSVSFTYTAYGVTGSSNTPTITDVLDAGSYTEDIAEGSFFVVKGTSLSAAGFVSNSFPLPLSTNGVSISFTPLTGGTATMAYIDYLYNQGGVNQLAAVLPSSLPVGTYNVTVTNAGATSTPFTVSVVKQKPGLITADSTGNGLVVTQNYVSSSELDVNRFTTGTVGGYTISPSHPGQTEIAYLVGSGPDPNPSNQASPGYNFLANGVSAQVIVGGTTITPSYLGRVAGGNGYEQINFSLPAGITTGCTVPFQVVENGIASQTGFLAIAPVGANACVQPGYTTSQLQQFDNGNTVNVGDFSISSVSETAGSLGSFSSSSASGSFTKYTGFELASIPATATGIIPSGCQVVQIPGPNPITGLAGAGVNLDAGAVTLTGPSGSNLNNVALPETSNTYDLSINGTGTTSIGSVVAGTYTLNGAGGTGIGPFNAKVTLGSPLTVTGGLPTTVTRSSGLTVSWTGGNSSDIVYLIGYATNTVNNVATGAEFICFTTAGAGSVTANSSILNQLPAVNGSSLTSGSSGLLALYSSTNPTAGNGAFTAPVVGDGTINAFFTGSTGTAVLASYQ